MRATTAVAVLTASRTPGFCPEHITSAVCATASYSVCGGLVSNAVVWSGVCTCTESALASLFVKIGAVHSARGTGRGPIADGTSGGGGDTSVALAPSALGAAASWCGNVRVLETCLTGGWCVVRSVSVGNDGRFWFGNDGRFWFALFQRSAVVLSARTSSIASSNASSSSSRGPATSGTSVGSNEWLAERTEWLAERTERLTERLAAWCALLGFSAHVLWPEVAGESSATAARAGRVATVAGNRGDLVP